ncbi:CidA/LrgA family protein [Candidatus Puniceispirillum sp.]|uniref:CidA/LrgA family protein n=1 Tax=Candidatus Puniceispirillum sp. TaxID=2026719 RepID=UPI003F69B5A4
MLGAIFTIFIFQLAGEAIQKYFDLAIPGPVLGLVLMLFMLLVTHRNLNPAVTHFRSKMITSAEQLLAYLSLLFVPIGVGVIMHLQLLEAQWLQIIAIIVIGTTGTMIFTAFIFLKTSKAKADE